jgi:hypothetical protein
MAYTIDIGGYTPEALLDVQTQPPGADQELGKAMISMGVTSSNLSSIESGDKVTVTDDSETTFTGFVVGTPSIDSEGTLEVRALDDRVALRHKTLDRVFYNLDSAEAVKQAVTKEAVQLDSRVALTGDSIGDWSGNVDNLAAYTDGTRDSINSQALWEYGTDMIYIGLESGASGSYHVDSDSLLKGASGGGQLRKVELRHAIDTGDGEADITFEIRVNGLNYVWDLSDTDGLETITLQAADADPSGQLNTDGTVRLDIDVSDTLDEPLGIMIDGLVPFPFYTIDDDIDISIGSAPSTSRTITRDKSAPALEFINELAVEDDRSLLVDSAQTVDYISDAGSDRPSFDIIQGETPVVDADFDRDSEQIINKVQVNGDGVQAVVTDPASIAFYGVAPRSEPINDESIKARETAVRRGKGVLRGNAWDDEVISFEVADSEYRKLDPGDTMQVDWPLQNFAETCVVRGIDVPKSRIVSLDLGVIS